MSRDFGFNKPGWAYLHFLYIYILYYIIYSTYVFIDVYMFIFVYNVNIYLYTCNPTWLPATQLTLQWIQQLPDGQSPIPTAQLWGQKKRVAHREGWPRFSQMAGYSSSQFVVVVVVVFNGNPSKNKDHFNKKQDKRNTWIYPIRGAMVGWCLCLVQGLFGMASISDAQNYIPCHPSKSIYIHDICLLVDFFWGILSESSNLQMYRWNRGIFESHVVPRKR